MSSHYNTFVKLLCILAVITVALCKLQPKPAASYFNLCRLGDPKELSECVKNSIMAVKPLVKKGIPALNIVPIEPLVIPRMELNQGQGTFQLKTTLTNFTIHGLGEYAVKRAKLSLDDKQFFMDLAMITPEMLMTANYEMAGQILVVPISGKGHCEMNFTDVATDLHANGRIVTRGAQQFIELLNMKWDIAINGKSRTWFYNLFNGDKTLGDATNNFLNENAKDAFQATKHLPEEAFGQVFKELASNVFDQYPITELFLD